MACCWRLLLFSTLAHALTQVRYGKYFRYDAEDSWKKVYTENSLFLFKPQSTLANQKLPVVMQAYGNAWRRPFKPVQSYMGPFQTENGVTKAFNKRGIAYLSLGYRAIDTVYFFTNKQGVVEEEEMIHVDTEGRLSLDTTGKAMKDFKVRTCWMELIVKSVFDVVAAMENFITATAGAEGLDPHRIFFTASSAGSAEVNYLTWVYHKYNVKRYTPVGMMLMDPQFNLPVFCATGDALKMWVDVAGADTPIKHIMSQFECHQFLGNWRCDPSVRHGIKDGMNPTEICNSTYDTQAVNRFCTANIFDKVTIGEVYKHSQWPKDAANVGLGMEKLWYTARNMAAHAPKPFSMFVSSFQHGMEHGGTSAFGYAMSAYKAKLDFVVYYLDHKGFRDTSSVPGFPKPHVVGKLPHRTLLEAESFPWRKMAPGVTGFDEHLLFVCKVFSLPCAPQLPVPARQLRGSSQANFSAKSESEQVQMV